MKASELQEELWPSASLLGSSDAKRRVMKKKIKNPILGGSWWLERAESVTSTASEALPVPSSKPASALVAFSPMARTEPWFPAEVLGCPLTCARLPQRH